MTTIVISGLPCSGNSTVGELIAKKFDLEFLSVGKLFKEKGQGSGETDKDLDFLKKPESKGKEFNDWLDNLQKERAKRGNIVIDSKLGIYFLKELADKCIFLVAPFEIRAQRLANREGDLEKSKKKLRDKDEMELEHFKEIYGIDWVEIQKDNADLVIDTSTKNPEEIVAEIVDKLGM